MAQSTSVTIGVEKVVHEQIPAPIFTAQLKCRPKNPHAASAAAAKGGTQPAPSAAAAGGTRPAPSATSEGGTRPAPVESSAEPPQGARGTGAVGLQNVQHEYWIPALGSVEYDLKHARIHFLLNAKVNKRRPRAPTLQLRGGIAADTSVRFTLRTFPRRRTWPMYLQGPFGIWESRE